MAKTSSPNGGRSRFGLYATISVLATLGATGTIAYYAVEFWMQPVTPVVLAATALLLPLLALNSVLALVLSDEDESVVDALRPALLASLGIGLLGVVAGASWLSPSVRSHGLDQAADQGIRSGVIGALEDSSDKIVVDACSRLFELGITGHRQPLVDLLDRRPAVARKCLLGARENGADDVSEISQVVTERWHRQLLGEGASDGNRTAILARELARLPRADEAGIPALLSCTLRAADKSTRSICAKSIAEQVGKGDELAGALGNSIIRTVAEKLGAPLVQASLHQLQLSDDAKARAVRLGLTSTEMTRYVAGFACAYTLNSRRTNEVTAQLGAWLDSRACRASVSNPEQNISAWHRVCRQLGDRLPSTDDPRSLICKAVRADSSRQTVSRAKSIVHASASGAREQFLQARILAGVAMKKGRQNHSLSALGQFGDSADDASGMVGSIMAKMEDPEFRTKVERLLDATSGIDTKGKRKEELNYEDRGMDGEQKQKAREALKEFTGKGGVLEGADGIDAENGTFDAERFKRSMNSKD